MFPDGKRFALALTVCFDAQATWLAKGMTHPAVLARGEYDGEVGVPRVLDVLGRHQLPATWFIPGHSLETWPDLSREIVSRGHEVGAHGVYHERLENMPEPTERKLMEQQLAQHEAILGTRPRGYRAPFGTITYNTYKILEDFGFDWHSSLCGRDFEPYQPREILDVDPFKATIYGREYDIVEYSTSWYLEDWVAFEYVGGYSMGLADTDVVRQRWQDSLDYGRNHAAPGVMVLVLHSQCIARPHHMLMLERFLDYAVGTGDVWVATLSDIYDRWDAAGRPQPEWASRHAAWATR